jgi:hypothetical protein
VILSFTGRVEYPCESVESVICVKDQLSYDVQAAHARRTATYHLTAERIFGVKGKRLAVVLLQLPENTTSLVAAAQLPVTWARFTVQCFAIRPKSLYN